MKKFGTIHLMESKTKQGNEKLYMAHRLETPQGIALGLRESAEKIGQSTPEKMVANLVDFKQNIFNFMNHFNLEMSDFISDMEDKRFERGGFTKRAVQAHPFKGAGGIRLVRDKLSKEFLFLDKDEPYLTLLNRKLEEETKELIEAMSRKERREELGDVFEVFNTILGVKGITESLIESKRQIGELEMRKEQKRKMAKKKQNNNSSYSDSTSGKLKS
jgi:predicted house-cleaning noncanonical NTP pyrophosphatase (MazG superfamily)